MSPSAPSPSSRRFYEVVDVVAAPAGGWEIRLDGRAVRASSGAPLSLPTRELADVVAAEWTAQGASIDLPGMWATRLALATQDADASLRAAQVATVARYGASDLLCYFAEDPRSLVEQQERLWGPLLDWAEDHLGLAFVRARGIVHRAQPQATLERLEALAMAEDPFTLSGLAFGAGLYGSAVLSLAVRAGRLDSAGAMAAACLDEDHQQARWGVDAEAAERRRRLTQESERLERWFHALDVAASGG